MFNHILVPLDTSAISEAALKYVYSLVDKDGTLTLLTVLEDEHENAIPVQFVATDLPSPKIIEDYKRERRTRGEDYLHNIVSRLSTPRPKVIYEVQSGNPVDMILDTAKTFNVDAIVMSTHGRTGLNRFINGSIMERVVSDALCPVIVIPGKVAAQVAEPSLSSHPITSWTTYLLMSMTDLRC